MSRPAVGNATWQKGCILDASGNIHRRRTGGHVYPKHASSTTPMKRRWRTLNGRHSATTVIMLSDRRVAKAQRLLWGHNQRLLKAKTKGSCRPAPKAPLGQNQTLVWAQTRCFRLERMHSPLHFAGAVLKPVTLTTHFKRYETERNP